MKLYLLFFFLITTITSFSQKERSPRLKKGEWNAGLTLNDNNVLFFDLTIKKDNQLVITNGKEDIIMDPPVYKNDSVYVKFPFFNSELVFNVEGKKIIKGYWVNYNKGENYKIPFNSIRQKSNRFGFVNNAAATINVSGKWKVVFEPKTPDAYPALAVFEQNENSNSILGTFLTETGDYRFLEGNSTKDSIYLSCFDGSHAFLFNAKKKGDTLFGAFFSGNHWKSDWVGSKNIEYQLPSPDELTYVVDSSAISFNLQTLEGDPFSFPNNKFNDKVVIIQIMGSWCPNCLDETKYYKTLYDKYHTQGLEIISVCYEMGKTSVEFATSINHLKTKLDLDFLFLIGGQASKGLASEHFKMLSEVISFPTSIFIDKKGEVRLVHTGFNGPGTGLYYNEYTTQIDTLVKTMLLD